MSFHDVTFKSMGCDVRLIVGDPLDPAAPGPAEAVADARAWLEDFDHRLSRFRPDSELCKLNADPRWAVPASRLLRATVAAGLWAAEESGGLVDPTLVGELEAAGYTTSLADAEPAPLAEALRVAPPRRAAQPAAAARWRAVVVDDDAGVIRRPPHVRLDSGGAGKGLAADALAHRLAGYSRVAVDCGGDVRVAGPSTYAGPFAVEIEHPLTREPVHSLELCDGAIATSGLGTRIWRTPTGFAHHLIDPATGAPAWTGLVSATAIGRTALEAETLSKTALLSGPVQARRILRRFGGAIVRDDGELELIGRLRPHARGLAVVRRPEGVAA
jgi:thiamine biosynthesis lipoprotein